jgi:hypothetical protein
LLGSFVFCRDNFFFHATRHMLCNAVFYTSRSLLELVIEDPTLTNNEEPNPSPFGRCLKYCSNADVLSIVQSTKLTPKWKNPTKAIKQKQQQSSPNAQNLKSYKNTPKEGKW